MAQGEYKGLKKTKLSKPKPTRKTSRKSKPKKTLARKLEGRLNKKYEKVIAQKAGLSKSHILSEGEEKMAK